VKWEFELNSSNYFSIRKVWSENLTGREDLGDKGVDEKIILKWILRK
jgi:hypothetical protein